MNDPVYRFFTEATPEEKAEVYDRVLEGVQEDQEATVRQADAA